MNTNKIKIAHILHAVGGVDVSLRLILENINPKLFDSVVIHGDDNGRDYYDIRGNQIIDHKIAIQRELNPFIDVKALIQSYKLLKREKPDLIHAHSAKGGVIGKLCGMLLGIPVLHTPQAYSYLSTENKLKRGIYLGLEKFLKYLGKNKILASSHSEKNRALKDVGYKQENVLVFNNSILPINTITKEKIDVELPSTYICTVGRPSYQKNIELMVDVIKEVKKSNPDIHLVMMGVGYHSPNLDIVRNKIQELGLNNNITLMEWTAREQIFRIVSESQLYLSTARYEGLPYSIIESLALGKPVVASDCDGNRDLVFNDHNGFLIKENDPCSYANAILKILSQDDLHHKFSTNSRKYFVKNLDMTKNIGDLQEIYSRHASSRNK